MKNKRIAKKEFIKELIKLEGQCISSKTGQIYSSFKINVNDISFLRDNSQNPNSINKIKIDRLFEVYQAFDQIDTLNIKSFVSGMQSPTCAILKAIRLYNEGGIINL